MEDVLLCVSHSFVLLHNSGMSYNGIAKSCEDILSVLASETNDKENTEETI